MRWRGAAGRAAMPDAIESLLRELYRQPHHDAHDERVRVAVAGRAGGRCEYCLLRTGGQFQVDHIIPPKLWTRYETGTLAAVPPQAGRRGPQHLDNFAWSCPFCNQAKVQAVLRRVRGRLAQIFDPRHHRWADHLAFVEGYVYLLGISDIGVATIDALDLNDRRRMNHVGPRHIAIVNDDYPPDWAKPLLIPT